MQTVLDIAVITVPEGKIRDYVDGKFRNDTPEEYVRQNIEKRLVNELQYPKELLRIEWPIKVGSGTKRIDIAVFPKDCWSFRQEDINIIIECKKESVPPSDKKEGVEQLKSYMAACPNCEWGMWTNGKEKEVFRKIIITGTDGKKRISYEDYIDIPAYNTDVEDIDRPKRSTQRLAVEDNLLFAFRKCHNHIYALEGMQKQPAFFELLKVIFCKIEDERDILNDIQFYATSKERENPDGQLTVKKRIDKIFKKVKEKYKAIFEKNDELKLHQRTLAYVVAELQRYSLLDTNIDVKGKAYEEIVGSNLRGDRGEFFTPRNIMKMTVEMIAPKPNEKVLDSSCGTGGFLVLAMNHVIHQIEKKVEQQLKKPKKEWNEFEKQIAREKITETARANFFGFDINPDLVKATKMNMVMNNDGSGNILRVNSLLPPHEWDIDFKKQLAEKFDIDVKDIKSHNDIGFFDVIVTNPPFGSKIPIVDSTILRQYEIANNQNSVPPEQLFVERCVQFLKPGGRLAIVVPDSILGAPGLAHIRKWLIKNTKIIASVDLHVDTFQPHCGVQTSILIVQKKTEEEKRIQDQNYNIFMTMVEKVGHDKRGNTIYKREKNGEIIYAPVKRVWQDGNEHIEMEKQINDQSILVSEVFEKWKKEEGILW